VPRNHGQRYAAGNDSELNLGNQPLVFQIELLAKGKTMATYAKKSFFFSGVLQTDTNRYKQSVYWD
jgi:hypothetical protein